MFYMLEFVCCLVGKSIWLLKKKKGRSREREGERKRERDERGEGKKEPTGEAEKASPLNSQTELSLEAGFTSSCISLSK